MYYIGLDVHKDTINSCVNDASGRVHQKARPRQVIRFQICAYSLSLHL